MRINRYIMECKLKNSIGFPVAADELIDTLWNVNKIAEAVGKGYTRINRYIMECK